MIFTGNFEMKTFKIYEVRNSENGISEIWKGESADWVKAKVSDIYMLTIQEILAREIIEIPVEKAEKIFIPGPSCQKFEPWKLSDLFLEADDGVVLLAVVDTGDLYAKF